MPSQYRCELCCFSRYHIEQKSDPLNQFAIDQTGQVTINNKLDRERTAVHTVHILAIDNPHGKLSLKGT